MPAYERFNGYAHGNIARKDRACHAPSWYARCPPCLAL